MNLAPLQSLKGYKAADLPHDLVAGIIVAALSIPVAMGYAVITGLPAVYGLYASIIPTAVYALITSSKRIVFGMDSAASAATGGVVAAAGIALGSPDALSFVPVITFVSALFLVAFSLLHVGKLMSYVPTPVMHGFITGISVVVVIDQVPLLLGTNVSIGSDFVANIAAIAASCVAFNPVSAVLAGSALVVAFVLKKVAPKVPASLVVLLAGLAVTAALSLDKQGVAVLGTIAGGLPSFGLPDFSAVDVPTALAYGLTIAVVVSVESLLALDTFAMGDGHRAHENRELFSFGIANLFSALSGCASCSASVSRTAASEDAGGSTQVVSLTAAAVIALVVLFLAPYLYYLPKPVLGAIVVVALVDVIDFKKIRRYAQHLRVELLIFIIVALVVMVSGAIAGVLLGVLASFIELIYRTHRRSHLHFLGVMPNSEGYHLLSEEPEAKPMESTLIYRMKGVLSFADINERIDELSAKLEPAAKTLIIDLSDVTDIDATATDRLLQLFDMVHARHAEVRLVRAVALTRDEYTRFELEHLMSDVKVYPSIDAALAVIPQKDERIVDEPLDVDAFGNR